MSNLSTPASSEQPWRETNGRLVLIAARRKGHTELHFPPLPPTSPLYDDYEEVEVDGTPVLYSYTIVHASPKLNKAPQVLGVADFAQGLRVFARMDYPSARRPQIGEALQLCLADGDGGPIYAFQPLPQE